VPRRFLQGAETPAAPVNGVALANKDYVDLDRLAPTDPLFAWWRNYGKRTSRACTVLGIGDSILFGQGLNVGTVPDNTNYMDTMTIQLQRLLNGVPAYGQRNWIEDAVNTSAVLDASMGGGYCVRPAIQGLGGFADPWRLAAGTTSYVARGMGIKSLQLNASGRVSFTAPSATGFFWWYEDGASNLGTPATSIYAGDYSTTRTGKMMENVANPMNTGLAQYARTFNAKMLPAQGKWTIEFSVASGTPLIDMLYVVDGDPSQGVKVYNYAYGGKLSGDFAANTTEANTAATASPKLSGYYGDNVDLIILYIGANDYANNINPATFQANLEAIIDKYRAAQARPQTFLLVSHFARYDVVGPTYPWSQYQAAMKAVTSTRTQTDYLDLSTVFPASQALDTDGDLVDSTGVHLTNYGQGWAAQMIARKLMIPAVA
jgi:lysophospholipase L1-like esterase